jgi:PPE-repeat protein
MVNFSTLAPEINSALIYTGAGSAPMLEASAAWDGLASELASAASSFSSVTSGLVDQAWHGISEHGGGPRAGRGRAGAHRGERIRGDAGNDGASAHVLLNRNETVRMALSNWFGLRTPLIAQLECDYEWMWAQDVAAMAGYHGQVSAAAAQLTSSQASLPSLGQATTAATAAGLPFNVGFGTLETSETPTSASGTPTPAAQIPATTSENTGFGNASDLNTGFGNSGDTNTGLWNSVM